MKHLNHLLVVVAATVVCLCSAQKCVPLDPCSMNPCSPVATCYNTNVTTPSSDDINNATLTNTTVPGAGTNVTTPTGVGNETTPVVVIQYPEGYYCGPCPEGYYGDGKVCFEGFNPCFTNNGGCGDQHCAYENSTGATTCGCATGFTAVGAATGEACRNINECLFDNGDCADNEECVDETPSEENGYTRYRCGTMSVSAVGTGGCSVAPCSPYATCTEVTPNVTYPEGYMCQCDDGFSGDGRTCLEGVNPCFDAGNGGCGDAHCIYITGGPVQCGACRTGYTGIGAAPGGKCRGINECEFNNGGCGDDAVCVDRTPILSNNQTRFICVNGTRAGLYGSAPLTNCSSLAVPPTGEAVSEALSEAVPLPTEGGANSNHTSGSDSGANLDEDDDDNGCWRGGGRGRWRRDRDNWHWRGTDNGRRRHSHRHHHRHHHRSNSTADWKPHHSHNHTHNGTAFGSISSSTGSAATQASMEISNNIGGSLASSDVSAVATTFCLLLAASWNVVAK